MIDDREVPDQSLNVRALQNLFGQSLDIVARRRPRYMPGVNSSVRILVAGPPTRPVRSYLLFLEPAARSRSQVKVTELWTSSTSGGTDLMGQKTRGCPAVKR
jgi:hypothetical protein